MNYYITTFDEKYIEHAEKLFSLLAKHSKHKIIAVSLNFDYISKYDNVICLRYNFDKSSIERNKFIKPIVCEYVLSLFMDDDLCYLDADILPLSNCDEVFKNANRISDYPLVARHIYDGIIVDGFDKNYEYNIFNYLKIDFSIRKDKYTPYLQTCVFLFNYKCKSIIQKWSLISQDEYLIQNHKKYCHAYDETILNVLLWEKKINIFLEKIHIDLPSSDKLNDFYSVFDNPKKEDIFLPSITRIPNASEINKVKFFHGKISANDFTSFEWRLINKKRNNMKINNRDDLPQLFETFKLKNKGVEVGSYKGIYSNQILKHWTGKLFLIDIWRPMDVSIYNDSFNEFNYKKIITECCHNIKNNEDRCFMIRSDSKNAADLFEDESLDFVYIDANHKYEYVKQDIALWYPKVRKGGILAGHDYCSMDWYSDEVYTENGKDKYIWTQTSSGKFDNYAGIFGVNPAVDEFCKENNIPLNLTEEWFASWYIFK